jgi:hypothetical protein
MAYQVSRVKKVGIMLCAVLSMSAININMHAAGGIGGFGNLAGLFQPQPYRHSYRGCVDAVKQGFFKSVEDVAHQITKDTFSSLPHRARQLRMIVAGYAYKIAYGSRHFVYDDYALLNNKVHGVVSRLCTLSEYNGPHHNGHRMSRYDIDEALDNKENDSEKKEYPLHFWKRYKKDALSELNNALYHISSRIPCYSLHRYKLIQKSYIKNAFARCADALSLRDNEQIAYYLGCSKKYIMQLIEDIEEMTSPKDVRECKKYLMFHLKNINSSFQHVITLLDSHNFSDVSLSPVPFYKDNDEPMKHPQQVSAPRPQSQNHGFSDRDEDLANLLLGR